MQTEPGTLARGRGGTLSVTVAEETYHLSRDDIHTLLNYCQSVPLTRIEGGDGNRNRDRNRDRDRNGNGNGNGDSDRDIRPNGAASGTTVIDGHITVHASGRTVLVVTRAGHYSLPFASFRQVACGEAVSAPLFPAMPDIMGGLV